MYINVDFLKKYHKIILINRLYQFIFLFHSLIYKIYFKYFKKELAKNI